MDHDNEEERGGTRRMPVTLTGWGQHADRRKPATAGFDHP